MGGSFYSRDVSSRSSYSTTDYVSSDSTYRAFMDAAAPSELLTLGRRLVCDATNPIVLAIDITGSMSNWPRIIFDKLPMFYSQLLEQGYLPDPAISFAGVGDIFSDNHPMQACDFDRGDKLDELITKIYLEGGGGDKDKESYDMMAYFYQNYVDMPKVDGKPYFFLTCDESYYPTTSPSNIRRYIDSHYNGQTVNTKDTFMALMEKYEFFMIRKPYGGMVSDKKVLNEWLDFIPPHRILGIQDPGAIIDTILGAIALTSGTRTMDEYLDDMKDRGQTDDRMSDVSGTLGNLSKEVIVKPDNTFMIPKTKPEKIKKRSVIKRM